jgi:ketosteroid isomerase-like protein
MIQTTSNDPRSSVYQAQQDFWAALKSKDKEALERLLAEDFVGWSPGQTNQDRAAFITTLTGFPGKVRSVGSENLEIHIWGNIAVVSGVQSAEVELADGQLKTNRIAITNVFQEQQGHCVMKLAHAISLD